ncbi:hypothetical protein KEM48_009784 [Puccinia striiformis f. sp. tritici PST-130]|nr:hypothetical protein KEM48_009784 [Puccinia striiformis f. sp. tritici PST-130]
MGVFCTTFPNLLGLAQPAQSSAELDKDHPGSRGGHIHLRTVTNLGPALHLLNPLRVLPMATQACTPAKTQIPMSIKTAAHHLRAARTVRQQRPHGPKIFTSSSDIKQWLDQHNKFRAQYKAAPLKWSETLVAASKRLTDTCVWRHTQNNRFGENMSAGQTSIREVVTGWVAGPDERDSYSGGNTEPSHFTQVVWQATTEVGCHKATCRDVRGANLPQSPVTFWACNYNPAGNVIGEIAQNVKAAPGGRPL